MSKLKVIAVIVPEFLEGGGGRVFAERRLIQICASLARFFDSHIAEAIREYYSGEYLDVKSFAETNDGSISGTVENNAVMIRSNGVVYSGGSYIGRIVVEEAV